MGVCVCMHVLIFHLWKWKQLKCINSAYSHLSKISCRMCAWRGTPRPAHIPLRLCRWNISVRALRGSKTMINVIRLMVTIRCSFWNGKTQIHGDWGRSTMHWTNIHRTSYREYGGHIQIIAIDHRFQKGRSLLELKGYKIDRGWDIQSVTNPKERTYPECCTGARPAERAARASWCLGVWGADLRPQLLLCWRPIRPPGAGWSTSLLSHHHARGVSLFILLWQRIVAQMQKKHNMLPCHVICHVWCRGTWCCQSSLMYVMAPAWNG